MRQERCCRTKVAVSLRSRASAAKFAQKTRWRLVPIRGQFEIPSTNLAGDLWKSDHQRKASLQAHSMLDRVNCYPDGELFGYVQDPFTSQLQMAKHFPTIAGRGRISRGGDI